MLFALIQGTFCAAMPKIEHLRARQVLDSRGSPTIEVEVFLQDGSYGRALVPSGASTGKAEALELRDHDTKDYLGRGVRRAIANVEQVIAPEIMGMEAFDQAALDHKLLALDGKENKSRLGANAILGDSLGVARAAAASAGLPLYRYLGGVGAVELPVPMVNILSGGLHGGGNADFQDFLVIPLRAQRYSEALQDAVAIFRAMKEALKSRGVYVAGVADEGGYAPRLASIAASHLAERDRYRLSTEGVELSADEFVRRMETWVRQFPLISIEDALGEDDWAGWKILTSRLSPHCQLIGDDLFVTNLSRLKRGFQEKIANAILVKMNQVGTLTETLAVMELARKHGYRAVISARSGETEDDSIADLAVATGAGQIKIGSVTRSERLAKYNRLLRLEEQLGDQAQYRGAEIFRDFLSQKGQTIG